MEPLGKLFVSHSHEDNVWCRAFVGELRRQGADVWYDEHNLGYGVLRDEIEREIVARPVFVAVLSPAGIASKWVRREVDAAIHLQDQDTGRVLLPVVAETCSVPLMLIGYKRIGGTGDAGLSASEAAKRVAHLLNLHGATPLPQAPSASLKGAATDSTPSAQSDASSVPFASSVTAKAKHLPRTRPAVHTDTDLYDEERRAAAVKYPKWLVPALVAGGVIALIAMGFIADQTLYLIGPLLLTVWLYLLEVIVLCSLFRAPTWHSQQLLVLGWSAVTLFFAVIVRTQYFPMLDSQLQISPWSYTLLDLGILAAFLVATASRWPVLLRRLSADSKTSATGIAAQVSGGLITAGILALLLALLFRTEVIHATLGYPVAACTVSWPVGCLRGITQDPLTLSRIDVIVASILLTVGMLSAGLIALSDAAQSRAIARASASGLVQIAWPTLIAVASVGIVQIVSTVANYLDLSFKGLQEIPLLLILLGLVVLVAVSAIGAAALLMLRWRVVTNSARFLWMVFLYVIPRLWIVSLSLWAFNVLLEQFDAYVSRPFDPLDWGFMMSFVAMLVLLLIKVARRNSDKSNATQRSSVDFQS